MSRIKAIIYTSSDGGNDLIFENEDILAISTNTKCIENENLPEFDIFPNSGTLTVKDRNLNIYNKAINGVFDNYEYKVEYYLENQIIATHIINQRPRYDYDAKTCTFYLGNSLDKLANQTFTPYVYPLKSETLDIIFENVLGTIFNINEDDYTELMSNVWGTYTTQNFNSSLTFAEYFQKINITYPYISQTNSREALKTILLIAQCGMYLDKNNKLKLIRLDGYSNATADEYYNNVYKIEPRHINKGFVPSVILDNRFNKFDLDKYDVNEIVTNNDDILNDTVNNSNNLSRYLTSITQDKIDVDENLLKDKSAFVVQDVNIGSKVSSGTYLDWSIFALTKQNVDKYSFLNIEHYLDINFNYNLNQILNVNQAMVEDYNGELSISNPSINLIYEKRTITSKGYFKGLKYNDDDVDLAPAKNWVFEEWERLNDTTETVSLFPLSGEDKNNYSIPVGKVTINLECATNINRNNTSIIEKQTKTYRGEINILAEKQISYYYGTFLKEYPSIPSSSSNTDFGYLEGDNWLSHITKVTTTYTLQQIEITYKGLTKKITFNKNVFSKGTNFDYNLQSNLELNQDKSFIRGTITYNAILSNLLNTFNGGLHTGTVTTVATDYDTYLPTDTSQIGRNKDKKIFEIGDKVMPFKDKPIINRVTSGVEEPVVFQIVDCETFNEGGATFQNLVLREIKKPT